ncbi:hypothetical protein ACF1GR_30990, partial [Streptomyces albidoflavus]
SGTRSARTPDTLPTKIAEHKTRSQTHSETISYWGGSFTQSNNTTKSKEWVRSSWQTHCYTTTGLLSVTGQGQFQTPAASC